MKIKLMIIGILLLSILCGCTLEGMDTEVDTNTEDIVIAEELLLEDFEQMTDAVMHQHTFLFVDKDEYQERVKSAREQINGDMRLADFYKLLKNLVADLKCGHSKVYTSQVMKDYRMNHGSYLPLQVEIIDDNAIITESFAEEQVQHGETIIKINDHMIEDIVKASFELMAADGDNESTKYYMLSHWFSECLYESIGESETYTVEVENSVGDQSEIVLQGITEAELEERRGEWVNRDDFEVAIMDDYGLIRLPSFSYYEDDDYREYKTALDTFFDDMSKREGLPLLIDIRDNWGGDPRASAYLLRYLVDKPFVYFDDVDGGRFYSEFIQNVSPLGEMKSREVMLLVDGTGFSTAGHFTALFKYLNLGSIIGQPTGGGFACSDGSDMIELNNTEIEVSISKIVFQVAVDGMTVGEGVEPDIMIDSWSNEDVDTYEEIIELY